MRNVRWYDASELCLSKWQVGPLIGLLVLLLLPAALFVRARQLRRGVPSFWWEGSALRYYSAPFRPEARHWVVVMLYRRAVLAMLVELVEVAYVRALVGTVFTVMVLMVDWRFKPFEHSRVQALESGCLALLVILSVFQVRSGALQSTATVSSAGIDGGSIETGMLWASWAVILLPGLLATLLLLVGSARKNHTEERRRFFIPF